MPDDIKTARAALDAVLHKSRVHLYKPIQIAEILFRCRSHPELRISPTDPKTYKNQSKKWRDIICMQFLGRVSTSSARYQDNLFEENAIPPKILETLSRENRKSKGAVEAYIYDAFEKKHLQLEKASNYCLKSTKDTFDAKEFLNKFRKQKGLKRNIDKIFEIFVCSLFEVLTTEMSIKIDIYHDQKNLKILREFSAFAEKVLGVYADKNKKTLEAHFRRVGVTNAADRGLDMYANFGSVVPIKHLSLDEELAEDIVTSMTSDRIIIVCKNTEENIINSLLTQIGWRSRIQAIITIDELTDWYTKALKGRYSGILGEKIIAVLSSEIRSEFPSIDSSDFQKFKKQRGYEKLSSEYWNINTWELPQKKPQSYWRQYHHEINRASADMQHFQCVHYPHISESEELSSICWNENFFLGIGNYGCGVSDCVSNYLKSIQLRALTAILFSLKLSITVAAS